MKGLQLLATGGHLFCNPAKAGLIVIWLNIF